MNEGYLWSRSEVLGARLGPVLLIELLCLYMHPEDRTRHLLQQYPWWTESPGSPLPRGMRPLTRTLVANFGHAGGTDKDGRSQEASTR